MMESKPAEYSTLAVPPKREWSTRLFLGMLGLIACVYAVILTYHVMRPVETVSEDSGILEQCRQICLKYGLVMTGNVRHDAEAYLEVAQQKRLRQGIMEILNDSQLTTVATQPHGLLQSDAPDFTLPDDRSHPQTLSKLGRNRPVVVVFYLGYGCSHCVAQLIGIERDLHYFRELDVDVVAISSDSPEHTAERFQEYGRFGFSVLSDANNVTAGQWGVYRPETDTQSELREHGTFVVDRYGKVIWAATGSEPFLDNRTLLAVLAKSQGLISEPTAATSDGSLRH